MVEVRCAVARTVAEQRYRARTRDPRHLDALRRDDELWGAPVAPLGLGPLVEVDTAGPVDLAEIAGRVLAHLDGGFMDRPRGGYGPRMTTTPQEPSPDPEVVPSGDPEPIETPEPGEEPRPEPRP